jgi:hypothetical protein
VATEQVGRVRTCRLGDRRLDDELSWARAYRAHLLGRLDRLQAFVESGPLEDERG